MNRRILNPNVGGVRGVLAVIRLSTAYSITCWLSYVSAIQYDEIFASSPFALNS